MKERISITDIARLAGVSSSTVSHVLNQTRYVSPEITERVMKIVADTGYHKIVWPVRCGRNAPTPSVSSCPA